MTKSDFLAAEKEILAGFKEQTRWVIGVVIATGIGLASLIVALHYH
jgi:hypothetical protein